MIWKMDFNIIKVYLLIFLFNIKNCVGFESPRNSSSGHHRQKRSVVNLYQMVRCGTTCDPISYKGYGCYCGFMGEGYPVDDIDKCCQSHDQCYNEAHVCRGNILYFTSYDFSCERGEPVCNEDRGYSRRANCGNFLCQCDKAFVDCVRKHPCPSARPVCTSSPWSFLLNFGLVGRKVAQVLQFLL
ncbi:UNVERIFIED_CONTAM: hypothetical protein RMT77_013725 [Armadillidium vulgare]